MTQEEKAKAFDEAIEKAKQTLEASSAPEAKMIVYHFFPGLCESEDERIRKVIYKLLLGMRSEIFTSQDEIVTKEKTLAWLEKQKELPTNEEMLRTLRAEYEKGVADTIAKYEQKEQKPAEYGDEFIIEAEEYASKVNCGEYKVEVTEAYIAGALRANNKPVECSEEDEKTIWGLTAYIPNEELERLGVTRDDILKKLKSFRPQPIQLKEAYKDGFQTARRAMALAFMDNLNENRPKGKMGLSNGECEDIDKAFKEGDWAKIMRYVEKYSPQSKQEWSEEDDGVLGQIITAFHRIANGCEHYFSQDTARVFEEKLKSLRPRPKQRWTEEDDRICHLIMANLSESARHAITLPMETVNDFNNWLRTLQCMPPFFTDWNEEDQTLLSDALGCVTMVKELKKRGKLKNFHISCSYDELRSWIRSLKSRPRKQPHWKPSEEHLSALLAIFNDPNNIGSQTCQLALTDLYEQLKKLK